jgi:hypothetical protein
LQLALDSLHRLLCRHGLGIGDHELVVELDALANDRVLHRQL